MSHLEPQEVEEEVFWGPVTERERELSMKYPILDEWKRYGSDDASKKKKEQEGENSVQFSSMSTNSFLHLVTPWNEDVAAMQTYVKMCDQSQENASLDSFLTAELECQVLSPGNVDGDSQMVSSTNAELPKDTFSDKEVISTKTEIDNGLVVPNNTPLAIRSEASSPCKIADLATHLAGINTATPYMDTNSGSNELEPQGMFTKSVISSNPFRASETGSQQLRKLTSVSVPLKIEETSSAKLDMTQLSPLGNMSALEPVDEIESCLSPLTPTTFMPEAGSLNELTPIVSRNPFLDSKMCAQLSEGSIDPAPHSEYLASKAVGEVVEINSEMHFNASLFKCTTVTMPPAGEVIAALMTTKKGDAAIKSPAQVTAFLPDSGIPFKTPTFSIFKKGHNDLETQMKLKAGITNSNPFTGSKSSSQLSEKNSTRATSLKEEKTGNEELETQVNSFIWKSTSVQSIPQVDMNSKKETDHEEILQTVCPVRAVDIGQESKLDFKKLRGNVPPKNSSGMATDNDTFESASISRKTALTMLNFCNDSKQNSMLPEAIPSANSSDKEGNIDTCNIASILTNTALNIEKESCFETSIPGGQSSEILTDHTHLETKCGETTPAGLQVVTPMKLKTDTLDESETGLPLPDQITITTSDKPTGIRLAGMLTSPNKSLPKYSSISKERMQQSRKGLGGQLSNIFTDQTRLKINGDKTTCARVQVVTPTKLRKDTLDQSETGLSLTGQIAITNSGNPTVIRLVGTPSNGSANKRLPKCSSTAKEKMQQPGNGIGEQSSKMFTNQTHLETKGDKTISAHSKSSLRLQDQIAKGTSDKPTAISSADTPTNASAKKQPPKSSITSKESITQSVKEVANVSPFKLMGSNYHNQAPSVTYTSPLKCRTNISTPRKPSMLVSAANADSASSKQMEVEIARGKLRTPTKFSYSTQKENKSSKKLPIKSSPTPTLTKPSLIKPPRFIAPTNSYGQSATPKISKWSATIKNRSGLPVPKTTPFKNPCTIPSLRSETNSASKPKRTVLTPRIESKFMMKSPSMPSPKRKLYTGVQSPVRAYIHTSNLPLMTNIRGTNTDQIDYYKTEQNTKEMWSRHASEVSDEEAKCCRRQLGVGANQEKEIENIDTINMPLLMPAIRCQSATVVLRKAVGEESKMPRLNTKFTKMLEAPKTCVIKHVGHVNQVSDQEASLLVTRPVATSTRQSEMGEQSYALLPDSCDGDISVYLAKPTSYPAKQAMPYQ